MAAPTTAEFAIAPDAIAALQTSWMLAHLVENALDAELSAADIEHFWRIPASAIRT
ncbi:hypothetical protein [Nocardia sp. NPDC050175]|uniref:hypothetical protein n=1 Tax=Nocardia sp. NPDC050175 TaxID=3364317 RepID=UPI0037B25841